MKATVESIKNRFFKTVVAELDDNIAFDDRVSSIAIVVFCAMIGLYFVAHQMWSTGFFTATFGMLEMLMLYGSLIFWIVTSALILFNRKNPSRDLDSFGGLFFVTVGISWLLVVFPFEFTYFADVLPDFLRFLLQWISNDIAQVLMVLAIIVHLVLAIYSGILRVFVHKAIASRFTKTNINEDKMTQSK